MKKLIIFTLFLIWFIFFPPLFQKEYPFLIGHIVDEANLLTLKQNNELEDLLFQAEPHRIVAVSLKSFRGKESKFYSVDLARHWKIKDGVLIIVVPSEQKMTIETSENLTTFFTDTKSSRIMREIMAPLASNGNYGEALIEGSKAVLNELKTDNEGFTWECKKYLNKAIISVKKFYSKYVVKHKIYWKMFIINLLLFIFFFFILDDYKLKEKNKNNINPNISPDTFHEDCSNFISVVVDLHMIPLTVLLLSGSLILYALVGLFICMLVSFKK